MKVRKIKITYPGSKFWLIFWLILFLPVGLVLLTTGGQFEWKGKAYRIQYDGSRGWLAFWTFIFFPVAILLFFLNGFSVEFPETLGSLQVSDTHLAEAD